MTLTLNFQGQIWNLLYLSQKWSNYHETKSKHIIRILGLKCDHQVWPWPWLLLEFSRLNIEFAISRLKKWSDCHETKSKHIDWTLDLKCDHHVWPWPWLWPWIFMVKYGICLQLWKQTLEILLILMIYHCMFKKTYLPDQIIMKENARIFTIINTVRQRQSGCHFADLHMYSLKWKG